MYYNEAQKQDFLNTISSKVTYEKTARWFRGIASYEQQIDTDVSNMTEEQCIDLLKFIKRESALDLQAVIRNFKNYTKWLFQKGLAPKNSFWFTADPFALFPIVGNFGPVFTLDEMEKEISSVYSKTDGYPMWPIAILLWLGLTTDEIVNLRNEDVDFISKKITTPQRVYQCDRSSFEILKIYANTQTGWRMQNRLFQVRLVDMGYFIKHTASQNSRKKFKQFTTRDLQAIVANFGNKFLLEQQKETKLTIPSIWRMGAFYRLKQVDDTYPGGIKAAPPMLLCEAYMKNSTNLTKQCLLSEFSVYKSLLNGGGD